MRQVGCVHSGETCSLSMRVGGHVGWYFSVPARIQISWDLVGQSMGPGLVDPSRLMIRYFRECSRTDLHSAISLSGRLPVSVNVPNMLCLFRVAVQLALFG